MWKCYIDNTEYSSATGLANHLRKLKVTSKEHYDKFLLKENEGFCLLCKNKTNFKNASRGYSQYCSDSCAMKDTPHREAVKNRFIKNPDALKSFKEKMEVFHKNKTEEYKDKVAKKAINTIISKYGKDYLSNRVKEQWKNKSIEERKLISDKAIKNRAKCFKYKKFILNETEFHIQGYEPSVINMILQNYKITESEIVIGVSNVPSIDCIDRKHYPDIYIKKWNLLIDVKSLYLFNIHKEKIAENKKYAENQGYNYIVLVFSRDPLKKIYSEKTKNGMAQKREFEEFKNKLDWIISSQAPKNGEGSTTSLNDVDLK